MISDSCIHHWNKLQTNPLIDVGWFVGRVAGRKWLNSTNSISSPFKGGMFSFKVIKRAYRTACYIFHNMSSESMSLRNEEED